MSPGQRVTRYLSILEQHKAYVWLLHFQSENQISIRNLVRVFFWRLGEAKHLADRETLWKSL